jgi:hypothetical protein
MSNTTFIRETIIYAGRVRQFGGLDWLSYVAWVGLMSGLFFAVAGFMLIGYLNQVTYPVYAWNLPIGIFIFVVAIAFDTIGHRTVYKAELLKGEALVHHITIFAGITSCLLLCLAYRWPVALKIPSLVMVLLSVFYSVIDEGLHWRRYVQGHSDRVEMWSHFFIFLGHMIMMLTWWTWFVEGYAGVRETLQYL